MKRLQIIIILCLLSFQSAFAQIKKIEGDTTWLKDIKTLKKKLNLKDFEKSDDEFNFRFQNHGQVIEIEKDSSGINGSITNHIRRTKRIKSDTLSHKIRLSPEQARITYDLIQSSGILNIPSDNQIKNWTRGLDGITYLIEHADKQTYWLKSYWTPTARDSIPKAITILNFVKKLSGTLKLAETYAEFKSTLPKSGCYNSGTFVMCYTSNFLELGYSGSTKLPLGFHAYYIASSIGKASINSGIALQYNFDNSGFHHLNIKTAKWNILFKQSNFSDFIAYNYQNRKIGIHGEAHRFQNHQIKYGLNLKNDFGFGAGIDYLENHDARTGGHLYASKWFSKPKISTIFSSSLFGNQVNYKAEINKAFILKSRFLVKQISLVLAYEEFFGYDDLYFGLNISLW